MYEAPDNPVIWNMEHAGYPDGKIPESPRCPVCYEEDCGMVYFNSDHIPIGCDHCISKTDADIVPAYQRNSDVSACPICGQACEMAYIGKNNIPYGCDNCISQKDSWEAKECFLIES